MSHLHTEHELESEVSNRTYAPDVEALADEIRNAAENGISHQVTGFGTRHKRSVGKPEFSARKLQGVVSFEPEELVLSVRAGEPLERIERLLLDAGKQLAFEPPSFSFSGMGAPSDIEHSRGSIGGVVGCGWGGPRRPFAGGVRDHVLGIQAINGRGEIFRAGGRVVKNVTGYDLGKLFCGARGRLGLATDLTFKVVPAMEASRTVILSGIALKPALSILNRACHQPSGVSGAAYLLCPSSTVASPLVSAGDPADGLSLIRIEARRETIEFHTQALVRALGLDDQIRYLDGPESERVWRSVRDVTPLVSAPDSEHRVIWRITLPPSQGAAIVGQISEPGDPVLIDWGGGLVWLSRRYASANPCDEIGSVYRAVRAAGGRATVMVAGEGLPPSACRQDPESAAHEAVYQRVISAFDPSGILLPPQFPC